MQQAPATSPTTCHQASSNTEVCSAYHAAVEQQLDRSTLAQVLAISSAYAQGKKPLLQVYHELVDLVWYSKPLLSQLPDYLEQLQVSCAARLAGASLIVVQL